MDQLFWKLFQRSKFQHPISFVNSIEYMERRLNAEKESRRLNYDDQATDDTYYKHKEDLK